MDDKEQKRAAQKFVEFWKGKGYEKGQTQAFWLSLLREVFGVKEPEKVISFEDQVVLKNTNFIDAYIPSTRVLIEQKGSHIDLTQKIKQSDDSMLTPFQQARRYISGLSFSTYPRWIIVCNFSEFHVHDMERPDAPPEIISLESLPDEVYRLNFLVQDQQEVLAKEKELSVAAGNLVGLLYDELLKGYKDPSSKESQHSLNVLCVRLVFCLYAEDAGIFGRRMMFHDYLVRYKDRPSDVRNAILRLFEVFDTPVEKRDPYLDEELAAFPYVNGSLFENARALEIPNFTPEIVSLLLNEASEGFDWSKISPTIFGAVFESTLNPETRRKGGMHYTSIENIHKVIDPLFLNGLKDELAQIRAIKTMNTKMDRLQTFHDKLASLTFFDPACGSGNFLTETYLSLRRLENEVVRIQSNGQASFNVEGLSPTKISLSQFYGIEINDFACAVAKTALWIAESQMLNETEDIIGRTLPFFPLKTLTNIVEGNALKLDWEMEFNGVPFSFIIGNPPFVGHNVRSESQKKDLQVVFGDISVDKSDYVIAWFYKAAKYAQRRATKISFVATNSICQGTSVGVIWRLLFELGMRIDYAWRTFLWDSEAKDKAHVHVVIVSFSYEGGASPVLFDSNGKAVDCSNINGYLMDAPNVCIERVKQQLSGLPEMKTGSLPRSSGFTLTKEDREAFIKENPVCEKWIKKYIGSDEFLNGGERYCLWMKEALPSELKQCHKVMERIEQIRNDRLNSPAETTRRTAKTPTLFAVDAQPTSTYIAVPQVSSERRSYVPFGYVSPDVIASNLLFVIPDVQRYQFALLTSSVHMAWMRAVAGRLKSDYRYSKDVVYNSFICPDLDDKKKKKLTETAQAILDARAQHPTQTLADMYDVLLMPNDLRKAHEANDRAVLQAYNLKTSSTEEEIVSHLMTLYAEKISEFEKMEAADNAVQKVIGKKQDGVPAWLLELRKQYLDGSLTLEELIINGKAHLKEEKKKAKEAEKVAAKEAKK